MTVDRYTKLLLTIIALELGWLAVGHAGVHQAAGSFSDVRHGVLRVFSGREKLQLRAGSGADHGEYCAGCQERRRKQRKPPAGV